MSDNVQIEAPGNRRKFLEINPIILQQTSLSLELFVKHASQAIRNDLCGANEIWLLSSPKNSVTPFGPSNGKVP